MKGQCLHLGECIQFRRALARTPLLGDNYGDKIICEEYVGRANLIGF
jgi:hypothetical protein